MSTKYSETSIYTVQCGAWTIIHNAVRAKVERSDASGKKVTAQTGFYIPGKGFQWTNPEPPKTVKERAEQAVRARRRKIGLPV